MWIFKKKKPETKQYCRMAECGKLLTAENCDDMEWSSVCIECFQDMHIQAEKRCAEENREKNERERRIERIPELIERLEYCEQLLQPVR